MYASASGAQGRFAHLELVVLKRARPSETTELYELVDGVYVHATNRYAPCDCGVVLEKVEGGSERPPCPLCGDVS